MQKRFKCLFASQRSRVRSPSSPPKRKTRRRSCLSFWVPPPSGRLHPSVIQMLGGNEFRLRRGFACGKTLVRRKSAAPPCGVPHSLGIYTVSMFHHGHRQDAPDAGTPPRSWPPRRPSAAGSGSGPRAFGDRPPRTPAACPAPRSAAPRRVRWARPAMARAGVSEYRKNSQDRAYPRPGCFAAHLFHSQNRSSITAAWARVAVPWGLRVEPSPVPWMIPAPQAHWRAGMAYSAASKASA